MNAFTNFPKAKALVLSLGVLLAQWQPTLAQTPDYTNQQPAAVADNNPSLFSSIASYRDDVRRAALLASQEPKVLDKLVEQQDNSRDAFERLIQSYGQTKQGWFYELARYPEIQHALAILPAGTDQATVQVITKSMPTNLQESTWKLYRHHHDDLVQADNLNQQANQAFENLIAPLDGSTQSAFRQLITMPDVLSTLTQNLAQTAQLGRDYQSDPQGITQQLADLHTKSEAQNQQELADYQNQLNQDPQARQELQQAGQDYARANGYNTSGINPNPAWPANSPNYYANPYSYWFGYPYWYGSPMWYPSYGYGFGTGFAYGLGGNLLFYGLPSYGFSNWFFSRGYYNYPHLYNRFNTYYNNRIVGGRGYVTYGNRGFVGAARQAFGPVSGGYASRGRTGSYGNYNNGGARMSAPSGRTQSMGGNPSYPSRSFGGGGSYSSGRSFGGGGSFGGGRSYGGGGGFRGGRR
ncbi:DUF3300 domain-containing protein [uncultured Fibrella sp.]|uniref:DUF3300 domain-containing protein n=1 Tax=uncultured Fibrella sp. TaxID=1284596 RepID=UPI0035CC8E23